MVRTNLKDPLSLTHSEPSTLKPVVSSETRVRLLRLLKLQRAMNLVAGSAGFKACGVG